jgi:hypothetical protein
MDNPKIVFVGDFFFPLGLPFTTKVTVTGKVEAEEEYETVDIPAFEAVWTFDCLKELHSYHGERAFRYAQALVITPVEGFYFRHWSDFCGSVLVSQKAVDWFFTFPIDRKQDGRYVPRTRLVQPHRDDVFFCLSSAISAARAGTPVQAVPDMDSLKFLPPRSGDHLVVLRASDWRWDEGRHTVLIRPQDLIEEDTIFDSEVRIL